MPTSQRRFHPLPRTAIETPRQPERRQRHHQCLIPLLLLLLSLLTLTAPAAAAPQPLLLAGENELSLAGHLEIVVDPGRNLTLTDVLSPAVSSRFTGIPGFLNRGYTDDAIWVRLAVLRRDTSPDDPILRLWPAFLDYVTVHIQAEPDATDPASYIQYRLGDHLPVRERPVLDADFAVPLHLPANELRYIYIRISTSSSLSLYGAIHTEADYITSGSYSAAFQGGYLAITLVISLINLVMFLRLKDRLYLYFSLYLLFLFTSVFPASGLLALIIPSVTHLVSDYMTGMGSAFTLLFFSLFGKRLFQDCGKRWMPPFLFFLAFLSIACAIAVPLGYYNKLAPSMFLSSLATIFVLTGLSIRQVRQGHEGALIYLAAFGISNIGYGAQFLRLLGVFPVAWWNTHAIEISSICNMVLMTLALTERVNRAEQKALQSLLASEQHAVKLAGEMTADLKNKQIELEQALERKARFVEMVSHEYRTPLAIIQANLDILELRDATQGRTTSTNIAKMQRAVARLVDVIESSLSRSRLQQGELEKHQELLDAADFLVEVSDEAKTLWPGSVIMLTPETLPTAYISSDPSLLKTAFLNLIDNAVKYSAPYPVNLFIAVSATEVRLGVADQGQGIPENERARVCEKYQRGKTSQNKAGGGLGLFLVTKIVEEHHGRLELSANKPNGTIATIVLPRAA